MTDLAVPGLETDVCPYCGEPKRLTTRLYGEPPEHIVTIVDSSGIEVCGDCVPAVLDRALQEQDWRSRRTVRVEPIKAV